jgi:hypothetical protein
LPRKARTANREPSGERTYCQVVRLREIVYEE